MLITLEPNDLWREYIYWRNKGEQGVAFDYLRREHDTEYFGTLIATIAKRRYGKSLKVGDWIRLGSVSVKWSWEMEKEFRIQNIPGVLKGVPYEVEWS